MDEASVAVPFVGAAVGALDIAIEASGSVSGHRVGTCSRTLWFRMCGPS